MKKAIIACDVFHDALQYLGADRPDAPHRIIYLPSHLHLHPHRLHRQMRSCLASASSGCPFAGCLYGKCFPEIDSVLSAHKINRVACDTCYELLLGRDVYRELMIKRPGSFFIERALIEDFDNLCRIPLELDDPDIRKWYFQHYQQIVYIHQPRDPDLIAKVQSIAQLLALDYTVMEADYHDLLIYLKRRGAV